MPVSNELEKQLFQAEIDAGKLVIALNIDNLAENERLHLHNIALQEHIDAYNEKQNSTRAKIEKYVVSPVIRNLWSVLLNASIFVKELVASATLIIDKLFFPLYFAFDGARTLWDFYQMAYSQVHARGMQIKVALFNIAAITTAIILIGLTVTNPFAFPIIFAAMIGAGIFKTIYLSREISRIIIQEEEIVKELESKISILEAQNNDPVAQSHLTLFKTQKSRHDQQVIQLHEQLFQTRRELSFTVIASVAIGLLFAGIFFPPLIAAGLFIFAGAGIVNLIDSKTNYWATRKISHAFTGIANGISSVWNKLKNCFSNTKISALEPAMTIKSEKPYKSLIGNGPDQEVDEKKENVANKPSAKKSENDFSFQQKGSYAPLTFHGKKQPELGISHTNKLQQTYTRG